ncbi:MAG: PDDEXK nuclease domain-containing protein [Planctomycetales bacterium]|nr:PDDEXK nuclease domain-containing protein [Planctomycetales bacterium]
MKITKTFFDDIRKLIVAARTTVARGVDLVQVHTNFEIGRRIVEQEQKGKDRAAYGKEVVRALAERLTDEFGTGFSKSNLEYRRRFYSLYQDRLRIAQTASGQLTGRKKAQTASAQLVLSKKSQALSGQSPIAQTASGPLIVGPKLQTPSGNSQPNLIAQSPIAQFEIAQSMIGQSLAPTSGSPRPFTLSWSHYVFLLGIKNPDERSFYEIEATSEGGTIKELKRQFDSSLYERLALSRDKDGIRKLAHEGQIVESINDLLKEPLVLEFLGLDEQTRYSESDLEAAILSQIERFLLELGKGFLFEARQKRFTFDGEHFFVDLVFYNRLLRCYVLIDLKLGRLTHADLGQMQMYVNTFDRQIKTDDEHSTIGIILCKQKNKALVEITLPQDANIHAREYQLYLPAKEELQRKLLEWAAEAEARHA